MKRNTRDIVRSLLLSSVFVSTIVASAKPLLAEELTEGAKSSIFLQQIRLNASPETKASQAFFSNKTKITFAKDVCKAFNQGATYKDVAALIEQASRPCPRVQGYGYMTTVAVVGVSTYCPEFLAQIGS